MQQVSSRSKVQDNTGGNWGGSKGPLTFRPVTVEWVRSSCAVIDSLLVCRLRRNRTSLGRSPAEPSAYRCGESSPQSCLASRPVLIGSPSPKGTHLRLLPSFLAATVHPTAVESA